MNTLDKIFHRIAHHRKSMCRVGLLIIPVFIVACSATGSGYVQKPGQEANNSDITQNRTQASPSEHSGDIAAEPEGKSLENQSEYDKHPLNMNNPGSITDRLAEDEEPKDYLFQFPGL